VVMSKTYSWGGWVFKWLLGGSWSLMALIMFTAFLFRALQGQAWSRATVPRMVAWLDLARSGGICYELAGLYEVWPAMW
jgi:hypothetical protein